MLMMRLQALQPEHQCAAKSTANRVTGTCRNCARAAAGPTMRASDRYVQIASSVSLGLKATSLQEGGGGGISKKIYTITRMLKDFEAGARWPAGWRWVMRGARGAGPCEACGGGGSAQARTAAARTQLTHAQPTRAPTCGTGRQHPHTSPRSTCVWWAAPVCGPQAHKARGGHPCAARKRTKQPPVAEECAQGKRARRVGRPGANAASRRVRRAFTAGHAWHGSTRGAPTQQRTPANPARGGGDSQ